MRALVPAGLVLALLALLGAALVIGDQPIRPAEALAGLLDPDSLPAPTAFILRELRLPRALMAALLGAGLGMAGAITQSVMRNPLAEPGILGLNSGAALAALVVMVALPGLAFAWLPLAAFGGALLACAFILLMAQGGGLGSQRLILIGIGTGALLGAGANFLSAFGDTASVQRAMLWLAGSLNDSRWPKLAALALWLTPSALLAMGSARLLDLLAFEDAVGRGLGVNTARARAFCLGIAALICGGAVAVTGPIGFVGLVAPHLARRIGRVQSHAALLPLSALAGAVLLLGADLAGRSLIAPLQIPAGIMAALIGAPFFGWLLWRHRNA